MKYYAYVRNMFYAKYCIEREKSGELYNKDIFLKDFLQLIGTPAIVTALQSYHKDFDMCWCYVEIKEGWCVKLVNSDNYGDFMDKY